MSLLENLPHTVDHKRRKRTKALVGHVDSFDTVAAGVSCWVQPAGDSVINEFKKRGVSVSHSVYFVENPSATEQDVFVYNGELYDVQSAADPDTTSGLGVLYRVTVNKTSTGSSS